MPLLRNILGAIRSVWSIRPRPVKKSRRHKLTGIDLLDHRQMLTVGFTGNVINDFPVATGPGVAFLTGGPSLQPSIPPALSSLISVTGFNLDGIALSYDPTADELFVGILQPDNGQTGQKVIAGDADNNLNSATVDPAILATPGFNNFVDQPDLGVDEEMGVYLDLNNDSVPDIIAGVAGTPTTNKRYQVALANNVAPGPTPPQFGAELPGFAGNIYLVNDPAHPAMEFSIKNFSTLYQTVIGTPLSPTQVMTAGAVGRSSSSTGISEGVYFAQAFNWEDVSPATDLSIVKTDAPDPVRTGNQLVYTLYVNNNGTFADNAVTVTDAIPAGVNVISITPSQGTATTTPTGFTANLGAIAAGGSAAITVVVEPTIIGSIINTATVTGSIRDTDPTNNTSSVTTQVIGPESCPPILVNPHYSGVINTNHPTYIRVNVFGSSMFDVNMIDPTTVRLSGATPVDNFTLYINGDQNLDRTFVFSGNDPAFNTLPAGFTTVMLTGQTTNGTTFASQAIVYNVNSGNWDPKRAQQVVTAVSQSAKYMRQFNSISAASAQAQIASVGSSGINAPSTNGQGVKLGSSTVKIPGVNANSQTPRVQVQRPAVAQNQGVQLGSTSVRIPITNGFGSPVIVTNAGTAGNKAASATQVKLNRQNTVQINRTNTTGPRVRANIANNINDFVAAY